MILRPIAIAAFASLCLACSSSPPGPPDFGANPTAATGSVTATIAPSGASNVGADAFTADFFNGMTNTMATGSPSGMDTLLIASMSSTPAAGSRTRVLKVELFARPSMGTFMAQTVEHTATGCSVVYNDQQLGPDGKELSNPTWASQSGSVIIDSVNGKTVTFHGTVMMAPGFSPNGATGMFSMTINGRFDTVTGL